MSKLSDFMDSALSKAEMKSISGGVMAALCYVDDGAGGEAVYGLENAKNLAKKRGVNWCCDSCGTASWCYDPD